MRELRRPGGVDRSDADQVHQMNSIFQAPGGQFHLYEGSQIGDLKLGGALRFIERRRGDDVFGFDFFAGEEEMNPVAQPSSD